MGFGDSGFFSALSSQLDLVGLHRFDGLGGDVSSSGSSCGFFVGLNVEATDLLRLWYGRAGLTNSCSSLSTASFVMVRLLELDPGRDEGSMELSLLRVLVRASGFDSVP